MFYDKNYRNWVNAYLQIINEDTEANNDVDLNIDGAQQPAETTNTADSQSQEQSSDLLQAAIDTEFQKPLPEVIKDLNYIIDHTAGTSYNGSENLKNFVIAINALFNKSDAINATISSSLKIIPVKNLHPTQKQIDIRNSLKNFLSPGGKFKQNLKEFNINLETFVGNPIVAYNLNGVVYIVDGHHRWSQVYCINPNASIQCYLIEIQGAKFISNPSDILKISQAGLAYKSKVMPSRRCDPGFNLLNPSEMGNESNFKKWTNEQFNLNTPEQQAQIIQYARQGGMLNNDQDDMDTISEEAQMNLDNLEQTDVKLDPTNTEVDIDNNQGTQEQTNNVQADWTILNNKLWNNVVAMNKTARQDSINAPVRDFMPQFGDQQAHTAQANEIFKESRTIRFKKSKKF